MSHKILRGWEYWKLILVASVIISALFRTVNPVSAAEGAVVASGTWGTCSWVIDANGVLTIGAGTGANLSGENYGAPWYTYCKEIKSVATSGTVVLPENSSYLFYACSNITSLDVSKFDTSRVTNMSSMFDGLSSLTSLDVSSLNTSQVTDMRYMFSECDNLTSLDVSSFNTGNAINMAGMFWNCSGLTRLGLSSFDTSKVTTMYNMFSGCSSLTSLDISSFNTSQVANMRYMFSNCTSLQHIYASSRWSTAAITNATNGKDMFTNDATLHNFSSSDITYARAYVDNSANTGGGYLETIQYTLTYNGNGGTPSKTSQVVHKGDAWGTLATATRTGYSFAGWYTAASGGTQVTSSTVCQGNATVYAQWYHSVFTGWNTAQDGSGTTYQPGDALPNSNLDLYAQWKYERASS